MSTVKELESLLRKAKKENRELRKDNEEKNLHIKFLNERLDNWAEKNAKLREDIRNVTVDDVVAFQKSKAEFSLSLNQIVTGKLDMKIFFFIVFS